MKNELTKILDELFFYFIADFIKNCRSHDFIKNKNYVTIKTEHCLTHDNWIKIYKYIGKKNHLQNYLMILLNIK